MSNLHYTIEPAVFDRFPDYVRGVVFAYDVQNGDSPPAFVAHLRAAEAEARARLTLDTLTAQPRIAAWREAFRTLGYKPGDFRPSIEALLRRVLRGQQRPMRDWRGAKKLRGQCARHLSPLGTVQLKPSSLLVAVGRQKRRCR